MAAIDIEARLRLIEEHVQAEIDNDMDRIMATWGESPWFDDVAWEEQWYGRDGIRAHYEELLGSFPDLDIETKARHVTDEAVILEVVVTGTHKGQWRELPPLDRRWCRVSARSTRSTTRDCWNSSGRTTTRASCSSSSASLRIPASRRAE